MLEKPPSAWIASIPRDRAARAAALWDRPDIEALETDGALWLRGPEAGKSLVEHLRGIVGCDRFEPDQSGRLIPVGRHVPTMAIPVGDWKPLRSVIEPFVPRREMPGFRSGSVELKLIRCVGSETANALRTTIAEWLRYAEQAPLVRLQTMTFAASSDSRIIVRGVPLPPVRGTAYRNVDGVLTPLGWSLDPDLSPKLLKRLLSLGDDQSVLVEPVGSNGEFIYSSFNEHDFVAASRSSVRLTAQGLTVPGSEEDKR